MILYDIKEYHLYKEKKSDVIVLSLSKVLFDEIKNEPYVSIVLIPSIKIVESKDKSYLYHKCTTHPKNLIEVTLDDYKIYKPKLKIKIPSLEFYSITEMIEYYNKYPLDEYNLSYNQYTKKITINKRNCIIDNSKIDMPIIDIEEKNIDILKNFGFNFKFIDKYTISYKEMYFLLAHQYENYYFEKHEDKIIIYNDKYKTNGLFLHLPDINKISISNLIKKCIVKEN